MEIIAKISKNDYLTGIRVFEKGDALSREEIVEAVNKAAEAAEDDGFRGTYVDLPNIFGNQGAADWRLPDSQNNFHEKKEEAVICLFFFLW